MGGGRRGYRGDNGFICDFFKSFYWGREVGLAGVGCRDGEKMQTIVTE